MKISEILELEKSNTQKIYLLKEGIFWRCYELSAMLFTKYIKDFKLIKKYLKCAGKDVVYMGFPESSLENILKDAVEKNYVIEDKGDIKIVLSGFPDDNDFEGWKSEIAVTIATKGKSTSEVKTLNNSDIIERIRNYPIASKTPIETVGFVAKIQKYLQTL